MRVLLDTNLLISYLLSANAQRSAVGAILRGALDGRFTLLFVDLVAEEVERKVIERPDLAARIPRSDIETLIRTLRAIAEPVTRLPPPYPAVIRDPDDDFLIAHAIVSDVDYVVSWDKDLRDLGEFDSIKLVSPPAFLHALRQAGRD